METVTIAQDIKTEFTEKKSIFITEIFFVSTEEEADTRIANVKKAFPDATHHCWAYRLRLFGREKCSDDGEPQGTAGMPILNVIKSNGISDVLIVVTRYFGGILLGAGGLVRAYTRGAAEAIASAGKAEIISRTIVNISYGYDRHKTIGKIIEKFDGIVITSEFTDSVNISVDIESANFEPFSSAIKNIFYNGIDFEIIREYFARKST